MKTTRRQFGRLAFMGAAGAYFLRGRNAYAFGQSPVLRKFIQPLPGLGPGGIEVATVDTSKFPGEDFYNIEIAEFNSWQFHPDLPGPTRLWGYADFGGNHGYLGGAIVAKKGRPVRLRVTNRLPRRHILPVDTTLPGAEPDQLENRAAVHLHGGLVPWTSDGGPFAWFAPDGTHGEGFLNGLVTGTQIALNPGQAEYYYPNDQSARLVWYHDHAMGITRLNAYAGIASAYIITDDFEAKLVKDKLIPSNQIPLVIQDKSFWDPGTDPNYPVNGAKKGDLWYPWEYDPAIWEVGSGLTPPALPLPKVSCVPEFFSDTIVVNGAVWPFVEVEQRHYRFRLLNGSQARVYNLQLYYESTLHPGTADLTKPGPRIIQIGTEGGFLPFPVALNNPPKQIGFDEAGNAISYNLLLAGAERADVIIDFSKVPAGSRLIFYNDAPAPFPGGDPNADYPNPTNLNGDTRRILEIRVKPRVGAADPPSMGFLEALAVNGAGIFGGLVNAILPVLKKHDTRLAARVRDLTLNEDFDAYGRLIQRLGTNVQNGRNNQGLKTWSRDYMADPTETPRAGDMEVWRIFNLTGDTHPIHFHLVNVQVLSRQPFDVEKWNGKPIFTGHSRPPDPNELGWKETVRMNPGECTTVVMKFDLPTVPFHVPLSKRTNTTGHEYVWHCHILEHEEHDMMRPLIVRP